MSQERIILVLLYYGDSSVPLCYSTVGYIAAESALAYGGALHNKHVPARVQQPGLIERTAYGPGKLRGAAPVAAGAIVLNNADGGLDDILDYAFDGREFYIYEVDRADWQVLYLLRRGFIEQPTFNGETITFQVRDALHSLDVNLLTTKYAGTNALPNGIEGTPDDIGGTEKPAVYGTCENIPLVQVNTSKKIYQIDGVRGLKSGYSLALYDKRAVVTQDGAGDYADQTAMEATAPAAGQYRVCPSLGCIRINFTPAGTLTADVTNPADAGGGVSELDEVIYTMFDLPTVGQLYDNVPDVGIYVRDGRTKLTALNELLASAGGFIVNGDPLDGAYSYGYSTAQLYEPSSPFFTPKLTPILITEKQIVKGTYPELLPPSEPERGLPVWRVNVRYARNWTVMTETDLAGIAAAEVAKWTQEYRTVTAEDSGVLTDWPAALELTVTTLIAGEADAQAEADRLLALFSVPRQRFSVRVPGAVIRDDAQMGTSGRVPGDFKPGARVTLQIPRFGLDAGKTFIVLEMREDFQNDTVTLIIWG